MKNLEKLLFEKDTEAYLHRGLDDTNTKYLAGIGLEDPFYILKQQHESTVITRKVNKEKVERKTSNNSVVAYEEYIDKGIRDDVVAETQVIDEILTEKNIGSVSVPPTFPSYVEYNLRQHGVDVNILDQDPVSQSRIVKSEQEIEHIRSVQSLTEEAMQNVKETLEKAEVNEDDELVLDGDVLTSGMLKEKITAFLNEHGAESTEGMILASGLQTNGPHNSGEGSLKANQSIVCDIFPRGKEGYFGDMTRTFVKGEPTEELNNMYRATEEALQSALETIEAGVDGSEVYDSASKEIQKHGYETHSEAEEGFIHSLGHGIGMDLHEKPSLNKECGELKKNTIVTVEPGVYLHDHGGVRIEDMVRVTEDGYENLNQMNNKIHYV